MRVVRRSRHLAANEARNLGADGARTEWLAFVENDVVLSDGWLDALLTAAEARGAASAYPVYLQDRRNGRWCTGSGLSSRSARRTASGTSVNANTT